MYEEVALNCFRYLDYKSLAEVDKLTIPEYKMLMRGFSLKQVDRDYRVHQQAYLNFAVKAEKKAGKNKTKPVYSTFEKFFDYDKAIRMAKGESEKESKFSGLSRFLKARKENE